MRKRLLALSIVGIFLCTPVLAYADQYNVTATVPAPLPTTVPIVTGPTNTQQETNSVFISGSCEVIVPSLIVVLVRDAQTVGTGSCLPTGTFRILVGLVLGANTIYAKHVTITGDSSGFGDPITLVYAPKEDVRSTDQGSVVVPPADSTSPQPQAYDPLGLLFDYDIVTYDIDKPLTVSYSLSGGKAPYDVVISWGDNTQNNYSVSAPGKYDVTHQYKTILPPAQISVQVTDAEGKKMYQSRALVSYRRGIYVPPAQPEQVKNRDWFGAWLTAVGTMAGIAIFVRFGGVHLDAIGRSVQTSKRKKGYAKAKKYEKKK